MADDRRKPADGTAPMDRMSGWDDNEATRVRPTVDDAATRIRPAVDDDAATRIRPAVDDDAATRIRPAVGTDATRVGSPDATRVSQDRVRAAYEDADRWAASASVSAPRSAPGSTPPDAYDYDLEPVPDDQPNWLRPLLFGVVGLLLLGALLTGIWLIYTADDEPPTPQASAPPATSAAPATTTVTTAAPTTGPPTTEAPPATVVVPDDLIGLPEDVARQRLTDAGLRVQVTRRSDATMAPGTVIEADPGPGSEVAPNTLVRIVVAVAPPQPSGSRSNGTDDD